jgi:hypothetical protein
MTTAIANRFEIQNFFNLKGRAVTALELLPPDLTSKMTPSNTLRFEACYEVLSQISFDCSKKNWDGPDSEAISKKTLNYAEKILDILENSEVIMPPEVSPAPDGTIVFQWDGFNKNEVIIQITPENLIHYAIIGLNKINRGHVPFFGDILPPEVESFIEKYCKK